MAAETDTLKFKIDDVEYELPPISDFTMDEWEIIYDYSGILFSDFAPLVLRDKDGKVIEGDEKAEKERQRKTNQPSFNKALLHVAYRRAHPDASPDEISALVSNANQFKFLVALAEADGDGDDDADPPESTTKPEPSLRNSLVDSNDSAFNDSTTSSDEAAAEPVATGITG